MSFLFWRDDNAVIYLPVCGPARLSRPQPNDNAVIHRSTSRSSDRRIIGSLPIMGKLPMDIMPCGLYPYRVGGRKADSLTGFGCQPNDSAVIGVRSTIRKSRTVAMKPLDCMDRTPHDGQWYLLSINEDSTMTKNELSELLLTATLAESIAERLKEDWATDAAHKAREEYFLALRLTLAINP